MTAHVTIIHNNYVKEEAEVQEKYNNLMSDICMPKLHVNMLTKYIKSLQLGRSPGVDGLTSEHLSNCGNTNGAFIRTREFRISHFTTCEERSLEAEVQINMGSIPLTRLVSGV